MAVSIDNYIMCVEIDEDYTGKSQLDMSEIYKTFFKYEEKDLVELKSQKEKLDAISLFFKGFSKKISYHKFILDQNKIDGFLESRFKEAQNIVSQLEYRDIIEGNEFLRKTLFSLGLSYDRQPKFVVTLQGKYFISFSSLYEFFVEMYDFLFKEGSEKELKVIDVYAYQEKERKGR